MARFALVLIATIALLAALPLDGNNNAEAGALPSNITGDADCSSSVNARDAFWDLTYYADRLYSGLACQTNGNVICGDEINLDDVIAILKYSGGLVANLPAGCPPMGVDAAHETVDKGDDPIPGSYIFNLDDGTSSQAEGDIYWHVESNPPLVAALEPWNGSKIGRIDSFLAFSDISYSQLVGAEFTTDAWDTSQIPAGTVLAVQTSQGNYAKVKITALAQTLQVQWVTWSPPPP